LWPACSVYKSESGLPRVRVRQSGVFNFSIVASSFFSSWVAKVDDAYLV
jgi:hypothetical protein